RGRDVPFVAEHSSALGQRFGDLAVVVHKKNSRRRHAFPPNSALSIAWRRQQRHRVAQRELLSSRGGAVPQLIDALAVAGANPDQRVPSEARGQSIRWGSSSLCQASTTR